MVLDPGIQRGEHGSGGHVGKAIDSMGLACQEQQFAGLADGAGDLIHQAGGIADDLIFNLLPDEGQFHGSRIMWYAGAMAESVAISSAAELAKPCRAEGCCRR